MVTKFWGQSVSQCSGLWCQSDILRPRQTKVWLMFTQLYFEQKRENVLLCAVSAEFCADVRKQVSQISKHFSHLVQSSNWETCATSLLYCVYWLLVIIFNSYFQDTSTDIIFENFLVAVPQKHSQNYAKKLPEFSLFGLMETYDWDFCLQTSFPKPWNRYLSAHKSNSVLRVEGLKHFCECWLQPWSKFLKKNTIETAISYFTYW